MDDVELKARLGQILAREERGQLVDWDWVFEQSDALLSELERSVPDIVDEFLRGIERRRRDAIYGWAQRRLLRQYLRSASEPLR